MKGSVTSIKGHMPGMASHMKVMHAPQLKGQSHKVSSTKISHAGGFMASRKKGSAKGSI